MAGEECLMQVTGGYGRWVVIGAGELWGGQVSCGYDRWGVFAAGEFIIDSGMKLVIGPGESWQVSRAAWCWLWCTQTAVWMPQCERSWKDSSWLSTQSCLVCSCFFTLFLFLLLVTDRANYSRWQHCGSKAFSGVVCLSICMKKPKRLKLQSPNLP